MKEICFNLFISINGGIKILDDVNVYLLNVDGVMMGCEVYVNFYILVDVDNVIMGDVNVYVILCWEVVI